MLVCLKRQTNLLCVSTYPTETCSEWSYLSWGNIVKDQTVREDFVTYEWVDLHTGESFEQLVEYLRGLLDKEGNLIDGAERNSCKKRFLQAVQLEEDFFNMPYEN